MKERIEYNHKHHPPTTEQRIKDHQTVREVTAACAMKLAEICPPSRELAHALTKMEEAMFWANAALARYE